MAAPDDSSSVALCLAAGRLKDKGHFARASEKYAVAVAAAAREFADDDCLILAFLRTRQAYCISCHSVMPIVSAAERREMVADVCTLLHPSITTLMRRNEAGTLMPGSCRLTEEAWFRLFILGIRFHEGAPAVKAHAHADAFAGAVGFEAYHFAAKASVYLLAFLKSELRIWFAAFIASALDLLASQPCKPVIILGGVAITQESALATAVHRTIKNEELMAVYDDTTAALLTDAWRRVERSGVLEQRLLGRATGPFDRSKSVGAGLRQPLRKQLRAGCTRVHWRAAPPRRSTQLSSRSAAPAAAWPTAAASTRWRTGRRTRRPARRHARRRRPETTRELSTSAAE
jgi:hypothetical protein